MSVEIQRDGEAGQAADPGRHRRPRGFSSTAWDGTGDDGPHAPRRHLRHQAAGALGRASSSTRPATSSSTRSRREPASLTVDVGHAGRRRARGVPRGVHRRGPGLAGARGAAPGRDEEPAAAGPRGRSARRASCAGRGTAAPPPAGPCAPGLYVLRASLSDAARNQRERERTCWVGYLAGRAIPARPRPARPWWACACAPRPATALPAVHARRPHPAPPDRDPRASPPTDPAGAPGGRGRTRARWRGCACASRAGINPAALWLVAQARRRPPRSRPHPPRGPAVIEAARDVAAVAAAVGVVGLLVPLPALRSEAQRAGALAVMIVSLGRSSRRAWCPAHDARSGLDRLGSPASGRRGGRRRDRRARGGRAGWSGRSWRGPTIWFVLLGIAAADPHPGVARQPGGATCWCPSTP